VIKRSAGGWLGKLYSTGYVVTFMLAYVLKWIGIVGVEVQLHTSLISALDDGKWLAVRPGRYTPYEQAFPELSLLLISS
jgi:hypothetical protein